MLRSRLSPRLPVWTLGLAALAAAGCTSQVGTSKAPQQTGPAPAPKPAGPKAMTLKKQAPEKPFDRATAKTPWKLAKVGDWAVYTMHLPSGDRTFKFEVVKVGPKTVTFAREDPKTGAVMGKTTVDLAEEDRRYKDPMTYDGLATDKSGKVIKPYTKTITLKGKRIQVLVVKRAAPGMGSTEMWLDEKDVRPFMQCTVKSIRNGKLQSELVDFGSKG